MALVPERTNWKRSSSLRHLALLSCAVLVAGSLVQATTQVAEAVESEVASDSTAAVALEPTATDVPLVDAVVGAEYISQGEVPEAAGDEQQRNAVTSEIPVRLDSRVGRAADGAIEADIARIDLDSNNVLVAVTWDLKAADPQSVWLRFLEGSTWSEWAELESASVEAPEEGSYTRKGTEPFTLFNADAVEVVAFAGDGAAVTGLSVVVIEADNQGELVNSLDEDGVAPESDDEDTVEPTQAAPNNGVNEGVGSAEETIEPSAEQESDPVASEDEALGADLVTDRDGLVEVDPVSAAGILGAGLATAAVMPAALDSTGTVYSTGFNGLNINTRKAWGAPAATGSPDPMTVKGAVIHHTLSTDTYTQDQVAQQIRNINSYHAYTLGWGDIGYNLVVDRFGGVWEGRAGGLTKGVLGAHATGANWDTFGITYLGGYQGGSPSAAVRDVFAKTIAWKFSVHGIADATGYASIKHGDGKWHSTPVISGHRDVGSTTCPGDTFYSQIPSVRSAAAGYLKASAPSTTVTRLGGADRYATNRAVNAASAVTGKPVFVVTGADYADALAASPAAARTGGSLFLVRPSGLDQETSLAIQAKKPSAIYVIGGTGAVPEATARALAAATGKTPVRVSGSNRYETSAAILERFFGAGNYSKVFVATGLNFPDALTAAAAAGALKVPVLLVNGTTGVVPQKAKRTLTKGTNRKTLLAVGGTGVVTPTALSNVQGAVPGSTTARLGGSNRYETNVAVNDYLSRNGGGVTKGVWIATGSGFADALSAATSAGIPGQQLTLSPGGCLPAPAVSKWIAPSSSVVQSITLVGSTGVLSDAVAALTVCG